MRALQAFLFRVTNKFGSQTFEAVVLKNSFRHKFANTGSDHTMVRTFVFATTWTK